MKKFYVFFLAIMAFASCSLEDDGESLQLETLPIKSADFPESFDFGKTYNIALKYDLPNTCYSFSNLYEQNENSEIILAISAWVSLNSQCSEVLQESEYMHTITVDRLEEYIFKLWKGVDNQGENIFEEIVVPVNQATTKK